jgi:putative ABC transport system permease protein
MGGPVQDLRYGLRQMRKNPGFAAAAVGILAIGIGANTAVFSILDAVLLRPLPYPHPEGLVKAGSYDLNSGNLYDASYPNFVDWNRSPFFERLAAYAAKTFNMAGTFQPEQVKGEIVSADFFETLGVHPEKGRSLASAGTHEAVVLSHSLWSRLFSSNPSVVGRSISLDGYSYDVAGIMPRDFEFPDPQAELWVSITSIRPDFREEINSRGNLGFDVVGRLGPKVTLSQAQAGMELIARRLRQQYPDSNRDLGVKLVPLKEDMVGKFRPALFILMASASLVLLITCTNVGTLLLSRSVVRRPEIALRSSLGATRSRIVRQLLTESLILASAGGGLGAMLAFSLRGTIVGWAPTEIPRLSSLRIDPLMLAFSALISILAGILFGLAPAWQICRGNLNALLKQGARGGAEGSRLSKGMMVTQIALSLVLLTAAGLLGKSLLLLSRVEPGFRTDHLLTLEVYRSVLDGQSREMNWSNYTGFYQKLLNRIEALPGVQSAGATLALPIRGRMWNTSFSIRGRVFQGRSQQPQADARIVSNNYFAVMKIPLRNGRYFSEQDGKDSPHVAVINETLARRYWPNENPIGQFIEMQGFGAGRCEIVGVVGDVRQDGLSDDPAPGVYIPYTQESMPWQTLVVRTKNDPLSLAALIRKEVTHLDPQQPVARIATLDQLMEISTAQPRFRTVLLGSFAGLALLLLVVGIYGVMAYSVSRRTREIGIRMAFGAVPGEMVSLVLGQSMKLTLLGILLGLVGAFAVTRVMSGLLFGVTSTDPFTFTGVTLLLCGVALLASYVPARRAMQVDPMVALRDE